MIDQASDKPRAEMVMTPGMTITAKTSSGTIASNAIDEFTRAYTWEGAIRAQRLVPRSDRWYGSLGAYSPGAGDHWKIHNGISRGVLEEGQQHFKTLGEAMRWIRGQAWLPNVYRDDGLFVGWGKVLERRQLNVNVVQIYIHGEKPRHLPGSRGSAIAVSQGAVASTKSSLAEAVRRNDLAEVKTLIGRKDDPNARNAAGSPLLSVAVTKGYRAVAAALLSAGANPNAWDETNEGVTPILQANDAPMAQLLLKAGANPNVGYRRGMMEGGTPLLNAAMERNAGLTRVLLEAGADPNRASASGDTPLHWAANMGATEVARLLLDHGARIDARNQYGQTPLMSTVSLATASKLEIVKLLIARGAKVNARSDITRMLYFRASFTGEKAEVAKIEKSGRLDSLHEDGPSVLDMARDEEIRQALKAAGAVSAGPLTTPIFRSGPT